METRHLHVLGTGGTIAGQAGSPTRRDYRPGQIAIDEFLRGTETLGLGTHLTGQQVANIGSEDIGFEVWRELHRAAGEALADPDCDGIVITHGTDTAEETAFLLDQTLPVDKPVVLVGAMRPADAVGSDGLRNFANAVRVASDPDAAARGVLVVMSDFVFAARDLRKAVTSGTNAFRSFPRGPIAAATPSSLEWFADPWRKGESPRYAFPDVLPDVALIHAVAGIPGAAVRMHLDGGARGIVVAGFGEGNMPDALRQALIEAAHDGVPVIRSTRVDEGLVDREPEDTPNRFVAARALGPAKARILLQLLLASGVTEPAAIQAAFERR